MQNIIYKSDAIIPWDTQSAFKMNSYCTQKEENMVFCYLKQYVKGEDLLVCTYCFRENPTGKNDLRLLVNLNPEKFRGYIAVDFGFEGISCSELLSQEGAVKISEDTIGFSAFKADDEQGFYWCAELTFSKEVIEKLFSTILKEGALVTLNLLQNFSDGDFACLFGDAQEKNYSPEENMGVFVILNY
ncbi:MAG: hypothetical protein RR198_03795 [Oscillospiraceae bacterium]